MRRTFLVSLVVTAAALVAAGCDTWKPVEVESPVEYRFEGRVTSIWEMSEDDSTDIVVGESVVIDISFLSAYRHVSLIGEPEPSYAGYILEGSPLNSLEVAVGAESWSLVLAQVLLHNESNIGDRIAIYALPRTGAHNGSLNFGFVDSIPPYDLLESLDLPTEQPDLNVSAEGLGHGTFTGPSWRIDFSVESVDEK